MSESNDMGAPEESLEHDTEFTQSILDGIRASVILIDRRHRIVSANRAAGRLLGLEPGRLGGVAIESLLADTHRFAFAEFLELEMGRPSSSIRETTRASLVRRADGVHLPVEFSVQNVAGISEVFAVLTIVESSGFRSVEQRLLTVIEASPSALMTVGTDRVITLVNCRTEELTGYSRNELIGQPVERLVPSSLMPRHAHLVETYFADPAVRIMAAGREVTLRDKSGESIPVEITLTPIRNSEGDSVLVSIFDARERKQVDALRQRLAAIVENSADAIISKSIDGTIMTWNRGASALFGYERDEIVGRSVMLLVPDQNIDEERDLLRRVRDGEVVSNYETRRLKKSGGTIDVSVSLSPLRNARGEIEGISSIVRDISEMRRRDEELKRSNADLEQFAHVASHDLQEPLRMVANYTELLSQRYKGKLDEKADKFIHYAVDGARRMQKLIADLLAYSRVGSRGFELRPMSTTAALKDVIDSLGKLIAENRATVEFGELPEVLGDESQVRQVFQNLIANALKFRSEAAPHIVIRTRPEAEMCRFEVVDNGIGFDAQYSSKVFQLFQRLHDRGKFEGSGIGLSIAQRIVIRHGGRIWAESSLGVGSTFYFTLRSAKGHSS